MASTHPDLASLAALLNARHRPTDEEQTHLEHCGICQTDMFHLREVREWAEQHDPVHLAHPPVSDDTLLSWVQAETQGKLSPERALVQHCPVCTSHLAILRSEWLLWCSLEESGADINSEAIDAAEAVDSVAAPMTPSSLQAPRVWREKTVWTQEPVLSATPARVDVCVDIEVEKDARRRTATRTNTQSHLHRTMAQLGLVGVGLLMLLLMRPELPRQPQTSVEAPDLTRPRGSGTPTLGTLPNAHSTPSPMSAYRPAPPSARPKRPVPPTDFAAAAHPADPVEPSATPFEGGAMYDRPSRPSVEKPPQKHLQGVASERPGFQTTFQGVVEQAQAGGGVRVRALKQGMRLGPDDALQLQWNTDSPGTALLVEQAPSGQRTVLLEQFTRRKGLYPMIEGRPAVYTPERGPGVYVYWLVWGAQAGSVAGAAATEVFLRQLPETATLEHQPALLRDGVRLGDSLALPLLVEVTKR